MALDNLVDGMTGLQMANVIKANFDKVLDAESAENKAENAGKSIKTDYDATRYIELQLADGTPVKMKMDVFCQAIAPVVAGQMKVRNFEAICIDVKSITYVQKIQTKLQNSVFGKYILKKTSGELSEVLFTKEVTNGVFSLGFESGLAVGSALLVIYGGA